MSPTRPAGRRISIGAALVAACLSLLVLAGPARASTSQLSFVEDELQMLQLGPTARENALNDAVALGADGIRALALWRDLAPGATVARRPAGFRGGDPASYPPASWDALDDLVRGAAARGLAVLLSPSTPIPIWASKCGGSLERRTTCKPDPKAYGLFIRALGTRYSGAYPDENQGGAALPRVDRWSFSNEPNQPGWLSPQYARVKRRIIPVAAHWYRKMAIAGIASLRATGHGRDEILLGETAPIGRDTGSLAGRPVPPAVFIRELFCLDNRGRRFRGTAARLRGCAKRPNFQVSGFAHHPYTRGGSQPPRAKGTSNEITIASIARLKKILDQGARARVIRKRLPIHYTEFGFQTNPPDRLFGVTLAQQAAYLNQSDYMAYRDRRVRSVSQYKLIDEALDASFQSGLRFLDGSEKPGYGAWRLPLWVTPKGAAKLRVYGQVRPAANGAATSVELQNAPLGAGAFTTVQAIPVTSATGAFLVNVPRREGRWRLRWVSPTGAELLSREAVATR